MTGVSALIGDVHRVERWLGLVALVERVARPRRLATEAHVLPGGSTRGEDGT